MNERDLRAWLGERASPAAAPDELRARVAAITAAPPVAAPRVGRRSLRRRSSWRNGLLLAAALAASLGGATLLAGRAGPTPDATTSLPLDRSLIAIASSGVALVDPVTGDRVLGLRTPLETWSAAWSADGRLLAFGLRDAIWTMDVETGAERMIAAVDGCRGERWWDCELAWSPDGGTIAVTLDSQLMLVDIASGAVVVRLDQPGAEVRSPAWSPDGATLAFLAGATLFTIPAASGPATVVVEESDEVWLPRDVAWSPDGGTLAWMAFPEAEPTGWKHIVIAASDAEGSNQRVLFEAGNCFCISGNWGPPGFGWSPDGTQMAFVTQEARGEFEPPSGGLFVIDADGTSKRFLIPSDGGRPLWRPRP
jgi:dipeptidyl aminopeptidase/acylaminoacyl peptidase